MWNVCRLSGSGFLQILIDTSSYIGLVRVISTFGSDALAGYTIGIRMVIFAMLPAWGLSNAAATMVGQALGAGKPERAEAGGVDRRQVQRDRAGPGQRGVRRCSRRRSSSIYTSDPRVAPYAIELPAHRQPGFVFFAYGLVFTQSFNGAGDTWTPTWINLAASGLADSAGVAARDPSGDGPERRVHRDDGRILDTRSGQRRDLSPRAVEGGSSVK